MNSYINFTSSKCVIQYFSDTGIHTVESEKPSEYFSTPSSFQYTMNNCLISVNTKKSLGEAYGTFQIKMINVVDGNGRSWLDLLKPQQLVVIKLASNRSKKYYTDPKPVMIGFINQITLDGTYNTDRPYQVISVIGADMGKALFDAYLYYRYPTKEGMELFFTRSILEVIPIGAVNKVMQQILDNVFPSLYTAKFPLWDNNGTIIDGTILDIMKYKLGFTYGVLNNVNYLTLPENSIWNILLGYADFPLNELFVDVLDDEDRDKYVANQGCLAKYSNAPRDFDGHSVYTILRPTPFISSVFGDTEYTDDHARDGVIGKMNLWYSLPSVEITDSDILSQSISKSSYELYNYFSTQSAWVMGILNANGKVGGAQTPIWYDLFYMPSALKYGLKRLVIPISIYPNDTDIGALLTNRNNKVSILPKTDSLTQFMDDLTRVWHDWNVYNHEYLSGSKLLIGNPDLQVGKRLVQKGFNSIMNHYIQSVEHSYQMTTEGGSYTTNVQIVRGFNADERKSGTNIKKHSKQGLESLTPESGYQLMKGSIDIVKWPDEAF
jgi:hypothetical protein